LWNEYCDNLDKSVYPQIIRLSSRANKEASPFDAYKGAFNEVPMSIVNCNTVITRLATTLGPKALRGAINGNSNYAGHSLEILDVPYWGLDLLGVSVCALWVEFKNDPHVLAEISRSLSNSGLDMSDVSSWGIYSQQCFATVLPKISESLNSSLKKVKDQLEANKPVDPWKACFTSGCSMEQCATAVQNGFTCKQYRCLNSCTAQSGYYGSCYNYMSGPDPQSSFQKCVNVGDDCTYKCKY
jgi:hypothetical protein